MFRVSEQAAGIERGVSLDSQCGTNHTLDVRESVIALRVVQNPLVLRKLQRHISA